MRVCFFNLSLTAMCLPWIGPHSYTQTPCRAPQNSGYVAPQLQSSGMSRLKIGFTRPGKLTKNYGKSPFFMGKSTIYIYIYKWQFSIAMLVYQRVTIKHDGKSMVLEPVETVFQQLVNRDANAMNNGNGCAWNQRGRSPIHDRFNRAIGPWWTNDQTPSECGAVCLWRSLGSTPWHCIWPEKITSTITPQKNRTIGNLLNIFKYGKHIIYTILETGSYIF